MNIVEQIQAKIYELSREERARLREWFDEFDGDSWDKDFDEHVKEKKLESETAKAKKNFSDGKFNDL
ncbi:MAG: hypothetical protein WCX28_05465 [Bacteriovoracaceae bacterium]|nr:hypothetical protein [Bacteroidota bacterium]